MSYNIEAKLHVLKNGMECVTSAYGPRTIYINGAYNSNFHSGIDLIHRVNGVDEVVAAAAGRVLESRNSITGYSETYASGNYVKLEHGDGYTTEYFHMATGSVTVAAGMTVEKGQVLGRMGTTGWSTGNHLHFGIRINGSTVDPEPYLMGEKEIPAYGGSPAQLQEGAIQLTAAPLYASSTATQRAGTVTGVYFLWSTTAVAGRVRITNSPLNVGRAGQVTGWIDRQYAAIPAEQQTEEPAPEPQNEPAQVTETESRLAAYEKAVAQIREILIKL